MVFGKGGALPRRERKDKMKRMLASLLLGLFLSGGGAYWVTGQGGFVGAEDAKRQSILHTQTREALLPPSDRALLGGGLFCRDREELAAALENFCS